MNSNEVCVDASLAVKVVVAEPSSDKADALFQEWADENRRLIAPAFFDVEADSIIRQKTMLRKELSVEEDEAAFERLQALPIQQISLPGQRRRAWEIAKEFGFPTVYDATYMALAQLRECEFWTADEKLFKRVKGVLTFVRCLSEYALSK
jgi:predicted nucleic acid-binding protein